MKHSQITIIMPRDKIAQLKAAAAANGCTPDELVNELHKLLEKDSAFAELAAFTAKEIQAALMRGEDATGLWPDNLNESLAVATLLSAVAEKGAEEVLLELSGVEMDCLEFLCQQRGLSYEELTQEALESLYNREGEAREENEEDEDDSDWWKK
jgi:hypothetical protein